MTVMKAYDGTTWHDTFTPKTYGLDNDGLGSAAAFNTFTGVIKRYNGVTWDIVWPPGADGASGTPAGEPTATFPNIIALSAFSATTASAQIQVNIDGSVYKIINGGAPVNIGNWNANPSSDTPGNWEVRLTVNSGSTPTGDTVNVWNNLTSSRAWAKSSAGILGGNVTVTVREVALTTNTAASTFDFTVEGGV